MKESYFQGALNQLKEVSAKCATLNQQMTKARTDAEQMEKLFDGTPISMETHAAKVTNLSFKPQPGLDFPKKGPVAEKFKEMMTPDAEGNVPPLSVGAVAGLVREAGLVKGAKLAANMAESLRTGLPDKLLDFGAVLEILAKLPEETGKTAPIATGEVRLPAEQSLPIEISIKLVDFFPKRSAIRSMPTLQN